MRGHRWVDADDAHLIAAMQRKVPESVGAGFEMIEREMLKGPWVMGDQYTICDPYLFTLAQWLEKDGVDPARILAWSITADACRSGRRRRRRSPRNCLKEGGRGHVQTLVTSLMLVLGLTVASVSSVVAQQAQVQTPPPSTRSDREEQGVRGGEGPRDGAGTCCAAGRDGAGR